MDKIDVTWQMLEDEIEDALLGYGGSDASEYAARITARARAHTLAVLEESRLLALQYVPPDRQGAMPFRFDRLRERLEARVRPQEVQ